MCDLFLMGNVRRNITVIYDLVNDEIEVIKEGNKPINV